MKDMDLVRASVASHSNDIRALELRCTTLGDVVSTKVEQHEFDKEVFKADATKV